MRTDPISKIGFFITGSITFVLLGAWGFLSYKSITIRSELIAIEAEAQEKFKESTYSSAARNVLRESKDTLSEIDNRFVAKESVPEFITMLESRASASQVNVTLSGIDVTAGTPHAQLQVKINGTGTWDHIIGFVTSLDSMPYVSRINSVTFTKQGVGGNAQIATTTWSFNLDFSQYLKEEK